MPQTAEPAQFDVPSNSEPVKKRENTRVIEAANRAEASALLLRLGYRVYRPEMDVDGEDIALRTPEGKLIGVQLKGRVHIDRQKYGGRGLWMLFPSRQFKRDVARDWYLIPHDRLYELVAPRHEHLASWIGRWSESFGSWLAPKIAEFKLCWREG